MRMGGNIAMQILGRVKAGEDMDSSSMSRVTWVIRCGAELSPRLLPMTVLTIDPGKVMNKANGFGRRSAGYGAET